MNRERQDSHFPAEYQDLLTLLARTEKYLEVAKADAELLKTYKAALRYLRTRPPEVVSEILGARARSGKVSRRGGFHQIPSDEEIWRLTLDQVLEIARDQDTPRSMLERIAKVRFGVTSGGLSALQNRGALLEKLNTLILNEGTHESIARVAGQRQGGES